MPNDYNHLSREELLVLLEKSETENRRLKSSQGFLSQGFDHAPLPTIRITPEGIVEEVNPYTCDFFGMPRETLIGINVLNNGPEEQIQSARENIARLTPRDNTFYQYVCHLTPTQQVVYYLWCNVGIFDPEGKLQYIISYCMPKNLQENFAKELREQALVNLKIEQENQNIITDVLHILAQQDTFSCENILQLVNSHYHTEFSAVFRYEEEDLSYHMKDYAIQEASALNKFLPQMKTYGFFSRSETLEHFRQGHRKSFTATKMPPTPYSWISFGRNRCISRARWRFRCSSTTTSTVFSPLSARITTCAGQKTKSRFTNSSPK